MAKKLTLSERYASRSPLGPKLVADISITLTPIIIAGVSAAPEGTLSAFSAWIIPLGWSIIAAVLRVYASTLTTVPNVPEVTDEPDTTNEKEG